MNFTPDELKNALPNLVGLLVAVGQLLPNRVDPELVQFLDKAATGGVETELLCSALAAVKRPAGQATRFRTTG